MNDLEVLERELPFAVYGTLRYGFGNDRCWLGLGARSVATGTVEGWKLLAHHPNSPFPYAVPALAPRRIVVELIADGRDYAALLDRLDMLEGYPTHYTRSIVEVVVDRTDGNTPKTCHAVMYHAAPAAARRLTPHGFEIASGDWAAHLATRT